MHNHPHPSWESLFCKVSHRCERVFHPLPLHHYFGPPICDPKDNTTQLRCNRLPEIKSTHEHSRCSESKYHQQSGSISAISPSLRQVLIATYTNSLQPIPKRFCWPTDAAAGLREIFEIIDAAEANLNDLKAEQLERMARLMEKYPGTLRQRGDWSQEPRKSEQHIITNLRRKSTEMRRRQLLSRQFKSSSVFAFRQLYLVPYDRWATQMLERIEYLSTQTGF